MDDIDYEPLKGFNFTCLEECGFCCSFPAEVREWEKHFPVILKKNDGAFKKWDNGHMWLDGIYTFSQCNEKGGCIFLKEDMRCGIYKERAQLCRTFPAKFFFGWRLQLYPSMSCRGFTDTGQDMTEFAMSAMDEIPRMMIDNTLRESRQMYALLPEKLKDYVSPALLQGKLIEHAGKMDISMENITDRGRLEFEAELSAEDFVDLPAYVTDSLEWLILKLEDGRVNRTILNRLGETKPYDSVQYSGRSLKPLSAEAADDIRKYMKHIAGTDHFTGIVYRKALESATEKKTLVELAFSELETVRDIFLLKASLMAQFNGQDVIDSRTVKDTIVLYDSYLATIPAYGIIM